LTLQFTNFEIILTYRFPEFAIERRNTKHQIDRLKIFFFVEMKQKSKV